MATLERRPARWIRWRQGKKLHCWNGVEFACGRDLLITPHTAVVRQPARVECCKQCLAWAREWRPTEVPHA